MIINKPPMGWNSWNTFAWSINDQLIRETADVMVVVGNNGSAEKTLTIDIDGKALVCTLAPYSFASYVVGTETTVAKMLKSEAQGLMDVESASLTSAQTSALTAAISANTYSALAAALADVESHNTILNPSFTTDASGWTVANVAASGDFRQATVQGKTCYNNWSNNFTSMDIHQDLSGLAPGIYTITAKSLCGEGNINDQHVYAETSTHLLTSSVKADDVWSAEHWETQTTAPIYVAEGDYLRVGYASTSAGGTKGWFCVTDFELTRIGDLTVDFDLSVGRKADALAAAKEAYRAVADEARLLTVDESYVESYRTELAALIATQAAQLDDITVPALVGNLQRELEEQMALVREHLAATDFTATPLGEGTFLLWDATASQFLTYTPTATNEPALSDTPTRFILASNGELNFYAGPGLNLCLAGGGGAVALMGGIVGQAGMEVAFSGAPLNLSIDWRPAFYFIGTGGGTAFNWASFALGIRYRF